MKGQPRLGGHANAARRNGCKDDRTCGGAKTIDHYRLTRDAQSFESFDIFGNLSASIVRNADRSVTRSRCTEKKQSHHNLPWDVHVIISKDAVPTTAR